MYKKKRIKGALNKKQKKYSSLLSQSQDYNWTDWKPIKSLDSKWIFSNTVHHKKKQNKTATKNSCTMLRTTLVLTGWIMMTASYDAYWQMKVKGGGGGEHVWGFLKVLINFRREDMTAMMKKCSGKHSRRTNTSCWESFSLKTYCLLQVIYYSGSRKRKEYIKNNLKYGFIRLSF